MKNDDVELIHRVLAGDEAAFSILIRRYQKQVHGLVWRKIGDFHLAEEITQDTFLIAYQKLATLKDPTRFLRWISVIANRCCITWLRKKRIQTQLLEEEDETLIQQDAYSLYVVEERAKITEESQREVVRKLLAKLPENERTVITLHYFSEMTCEDMGALLGVSTNTIKSRLRRAQQRLKRKEPFIRDALNSFQLSANLTENVMQALKETGARIEPAATAASKPSLPWALAAVSSFVIVLMLGINGHHVIHSQQAANFDTSTGYLTVMAYDASVCNITGLLSSIANKEPLAQEEVVDLFKQAIESDFRERAAAFARSVKTSQPHVIALRGISLIRLQTPEDLIEDGQVPVEDVALDFLQVLNHALLTEGLIYHTSVKGQRVDVKAPMFDGEAIRDVRFTGHDLVLTRDDVYNSGNVTRAFGGPYFDPLTRENPDLGIRGYASVDVNVAGTTYVIVTTQLNVLTAEARVVQAQALVDAPNFRDETTSPIIFLADITTPALESKSYQLFLSEGLVNIAPAKTIYEGELSARTDLVLARNVELLPGDVITHSVHLNQPPADLPQPDKIATIVHIPIE